MGPLNYRPGSNDNCLSRDGCLYPEEFQLALSWRIFPHLRSADFSAELPSAIRERAMDKYCRSRARLFFALITLVSLALAGPAAAQPQVFAYPEECSSSGGWFVRLGNRAGYYLKLIMENIYILSVDGGHFLFQVLVVILRINKPVF